MMMRLTRIAITEDDLGQGLATSLTRIADPEDTLDLRVVLDEANVHRPPCHEHEDDGPFGDSTHSRDQLFLLTREPKAGPIECFPLLVLTEPHDDDHSISPRCHLRCPPDEIASPFTSCSIIATRMVACIGHVLRQS